MEKLEDMMRAANRYEVFVKVENGVLTMKEAAKLLSVSDRHCRRLRRRFEKNGVKSLMSQRSHPAPNQIDEKEKERIVELRRETYLKYNLMHFTDVLKQKHQIDYSREFYRQLFLKEKLHTPRAPKRKRREHRRRFEAKAAGLLIQRDTSIHLWVPGAEKPWKLILDLDDHSRKITGCYFSKHDDVLSNMLVTWETLSTHGLPVAYYTDNNPIFNPLNKKPKTGRYRLYQLQAGEVEETYSQFRRALKELGIEMINATPYQPQGKGKVERIFRFLQDRLVNEMETAGVTTIEEGNKFLKKWVDWYNQCHVHSVTKMVPNERYLRSNEFRALPSDCDLDQVLCLKHTRQVKGDNTFSLEGHTYQLKANEYRMNYIRVKIEIRVYMSGKMGVFYKKQKIGDFVYKTKNYKHLKLWEDIVALQ
jgi:transposase